MDHDFLLQLRVYSKQLGVFLEILMTKHDLYDRLISVILSLGGSIKCLIETLTRVVRLYK